MTPPSLLGSLLRRRDEAICRLTLLAVCVAFLLLFRSSVWAASVLSINDDKNIQILAGPLICIFLLYWDRQNIFAKSRLDLRYGGPLLLTAGVLCSAVAVAHPGDGQVAKLIFVNSALVFLFEAGFLFSFGPESFRAATYPLACFWLAIPIPSAIVASLTWFYEQGSALATYMMLDLAGVSVLRDGTRFSIPGLDFNVAPECSGIRSGVALIMLAIVIGRLYLKSSAGRLILIVSTIPITILKNAVRISVTTSLGAFVDRSYMDGPFHHEYGGLVFFPVDFILFVPLLLLLSKLCDRRPGPTRVRELA